MKSPHVIDLFRGHWRFLSNFYPCSIRFEGLIFPSAEHAYQASKTTCMITRLFFIQEKVRPDGAKRKGKSLELRPDWELVKEKKMLTILRFKFQRGSELAGRLLATGNRTLMEGNYWRDKYWGIDIATREGKNRLGVLLMQVRDELRSAR